MLMRSIALAVPILVLTGCSDRPVQSKSEKAPIPSAGSIERRDAALDAIVPADAVIEKLADGFQFTEGPLWFPAGHLWFSDVQGNVVRQWSPAGVVEVLRSGVYDGANASTDAFIGPNGMIADKDGAVLLCQHGNRRIARISSDRKLTTVIDRFQGKRLNSPNDLVYKSDGSLYFTDPPYGLKDQDKDPEKDLPFNGVYRLAGGKLQVVIKDMSRPNGIALSPDEKVLYVANSDPNRKVWMRHDVRPDGTVANGRVFADVTQQSAEGLPDGMKVDAKGNVYATGPGGIWIFSDAGKHLGTIKPAEIPANCTWGDDGRSLYVTAQKGLYRIKLSVEGKKPLY